MNTQDSAKNDESFSALPVEPTLPAAINRRSFIVRNAVIGAAAVMTGKTWTREARPAQAQKTASAPQMGSKLSPDPDIVRQSKGPVMTVLDQFYKVGPGPSSS